MSATPQLLLDSMLHPKQHNKIAQSAGVGLGAIYNAHCWA
jgi:hypothetical protein